MSVLKTKAQVKRKERVRVWADLVQLEDGWRRELRRERRVNQRHFAEARRLYAGKVAAFKRLHLSSGPHSIIDYYPDGTYVAHRRNPI